MSNIHYSEDQLNVIGNNIAKELGMKKVKGIFPDGRCRWELSNYGNKTGLGLYRVLNRFFKDIDAGTIGSDLSKDMPASSNPCGW